MERKILLLAGSAGGFSVILNILKALERPVQIPIIVVVHAWAPLISPVGEPFRARTRDDDTLADWFRQADRDHDGAITPGEMQADADRFFAILDSDHNGEIEPDELAHYEWEIAPDIQVMAKTKRNAGDAAPASNRGASQPERRDRRSRKQRSEEEDAQLAIGGGLQGAARYGLLNMPEPVAAADTDFDRGITLGEFRQAAATRFDLLDRQHLGRLTLDQLEALRATLLSSRSARSRDKAPDARVGNPLPAGN